MNRPIKYGLLTALCLIIYFLLMKVLGQETNFVLRIFNFVFIIGGVYFLYKKLYLSQDAEKPNYFAGLGSGIALTGSAVVGFLVFLGIYVTYLDPSFMEVLEDSKIWGADLNMTELTFAIFVEGLASGLIISFVMMQYFRKYIQVGKAL